MKCVGRWMCRHGWHKWRDLIVEYGWDELAGRVPIFVPKCSRCGVIQQGASGMKNEGR